LYLNTVVGNAYRQRKNWGKEVKPRRNVVVEARSWGQERRGWWGGKLVSWLAFEHWTCDARNLKKWKPKKSTTEYKKLVSPQTKKARSCCT
jgi:hypothetical protein